MLEGKTIVVTGVGAGLGQAVAEGVLRDGGRVVLGARSGDKGNRANIGVIARHPEFAPVIRDQLTTERVRAFFSQYVTGDVERWDMPGLSALNFVLDGVPVDARGAIFEGGAAGIVLGAKVEAEGSLRGGVLRATKVEIEDDEGDDQSFELHGSIESANAAAMRCAPGRRSIARLTASRSRFGASLRAGSRTPARATSTRRATSG